MSGPSPAFHVPRGTTFERIFDVLRSAGDLLRERSLERRVTFFDTFDWRLHRGRTALSEYTDGERRTLEIRRLGDPAPLERSEGPLLPFVRDLPPGRLKSGLESLVEMRALLPQAKIRTRITPLVLRNRDGKIVLRLRIEKARAYLPKGESGIPLPLRLQFLPVKGYDGVVKKVSRRLTGELPLAAAGDDLLDEALAALGREPGSYSPKPRLSLEPSQPAREAAASILLKLLGTMKANEAGILDDIDSEFLHDFRVAVRRTRSALSQLGELFPARALEKFQREFNWLGTATGPARDMDVYLLDFPGYLEEIPAEAGADLEPLREFLEVRKREEYRSLGKVLRSARYRRLKGNWQIFLEKPLSPRSQPAAGRRPLSEIAGRRIWKMYRRTLREGKAIDDSSPPEALHELRITCKKLRYLLEFFQSLYPAAPMKRLIGALKGLQEHLGRFQDLHVQSEALQAFTRSMEAGGTIPAATFVAMGMLVESKKAGQERCRRELSGEFSAFACRENRRLFRKLFRPPREEVSRP